LTAKSGWTIGERLAVPVAALLGGFGLLMIAGMLIGALEGDATYSLSTNVVLAILLGVVPIGAAGWLLGGMRAARRRREDDAREAAVLAIAAERRGVLSPLEVAAAAGCTADQARATLDRLHLRGFCELDIADSGAEVYRFRLPRQTAVES
jgi:hypothetical protein